MRKLNVKKVLCFTLAMLTTFSFTACKENGGNTSSESTNSSAATNELTMSETEISVKIGETKTLTVAGADGDAVWASMDESIATVANVVNNNGNNNGCNCGCSRCRYINR